MRKADDEEMRARLPDWGFFHLSIPEAAKLVALDMWFSGELSEIQEPESFTGELDDPRLEPLLEGPTKKIQDQLINSVRTGILESDLIQRDFDDIIIPERAYISFHALSEWLLNRRYEHGEVMDDWLDNQERRARSLLSEAAFYRHATKKELYSIEYARSLAEVAVQTNGDSPDISLDIAYKSAVREINKLRSALASKHGAAATRVDRPLSTRQRRTLLTIIAALCDYSAIRPGERGVAAQIANMTQEIGAQVDPETIGKFLREIPEALETRSR